MHCTCDRAARPIPRSHSRPTGTQLAAARAVLTRALWRPGAGNACTFSNLFCIRQPSAEPELHDLARQVRVNLRHRRRPRRTRLRTL